MHYSIGPHGGTIYWLYHHTHKHTQTSVKHFIFDESKPACTPESICPARSKQPGKEGTVRLRRRVRRKSLSGRQKATGVLFMVVSCPLNPCLVNPSQSEGRGMRSG